VTDKSKTNRPVGTRSAGRKTYVTPRLREFGAIGTLTQAGSGAMSEFMANGMMSNSPNQRA